MIKLLDLLKEVGESTAKPYPYTLGATNSSGVSAYFYFTTDLGTEYQVVVIDAKPSYDKEEYHDFIFSFKVMGEDHNYVANKQELYRVMATVIKIMKDWIDKFGEETVKSIQFTPAKSKGVDDTRRQNLYMAYVKKQIPNWKFEVEVDNNEETFIFYNPNYKPQ